jgi:MazG family protein
MHEFDDLLQIADRLLGPNGCPWDQKQTLFTLQTYLLEEVHELIEAIDLKDPQHTIEELGDVFYALVFIGKIGEIENLFSLEEVLKQVNEKLIRRHPHIFSDEKVETADDVLRNWEAIKKKEKERKSIFEGIPPSLPMLAKSQKIIGKLRRSKSTLAPEVIQKKAISEEDIALRLWSIVSEAESAGIDAESALRRYCGQIEKKYHELSR